MIPWAIGLRIYNLVPLPVTPLALDSPRCEQAASCSCRHSSRSSCYCAFASWLWVSSRQGKERVLPCKERTVSAGCWKTDGAMNSLEQMTFCVPPVMAVCDCGHCNQKSWIQNNLTLGAILSSSLWPIPLQTMGTKKEPSRIQGGKFTNYHYMKGQLSSTFFSRSPQFNHRLYLLMEKARLALGRGSYKPSPLALHISYNRYNLMSR